MTGSAMTETFDEIVAAVPHIRLCWIGLKHAGLEIDQIPGGRSRSANVERKPQLVWLNLVADRIQGAQIGPDRRHIVTSDLGVGGIGHRRREAPPTPADALMHDPTEILLRPATNTGRDIRGDVRTDQCSEW